VVSWTSRREGELGPDEHSRIASMLRAAFPDAASAFSGRRSWSGARPELRVLAHDRAGVAAHAGVLRRFIQVVDGGRAVEQVVAVVGLVAVRPDLQGSGIGKQLGSHLADSLHELAVPFGLLGCSEKVAGYYRAVGWHHLPPTRSVYCPLDIHDPSRVVEDSEGWMVLPVTEPLARWPTGDLLWNGALV
jgi:nodulation protein A